jgi:uncharacterized membrane protein
MFATQSPVRTVNIHTLERIASAVGGGLLAAAGVRKRSLAGGAMVIAGTELIRRAFTGRSFLYQVLGTRTACTGQGAATTSVPYELGTRVEAAIRINRPRQDVYWFWRDLSNLPRFMKHVKSVEITGPGRSHWVACGPAGRTVEWNAEVINEADGERIGWRSVKGSEVDNAGSVTFREAPGGATDIVVRLQYNPPAGAVGRVVAQLFGADPQDEIHADLIRLKDHLEHNRVPV